jgi:anti-sigma factor RsiW
VKVHNPAGRERAQALLMAELDDELTAEDRRELDTLVAADPGLAAELARLRRVKEVTAMMTLRKPSDEMWDGYWMSSYRRAERGIAWLLVAAGALVLAAWGLWHMVGSMWEDTDTPVSIRLAVVAVMLGLLVLLFSVVRERIFTRRHDPYDREVIR